MLRQKGYSFPFLAKKYQVDHSSIMHQCKKFSVEPRPINQEKNIDCSPIPRICIHCKKSFPVPRINSAKVYCSKKCYNDVYFGKKIKIVTNENEEKIYTKNYKDYLKEKYTQEQIQRIKKALHWRGGGVPKKTMSEVTAERKKEDENRLGKLSTKNPQKKKKFWV